jgi:ABC-type amino acid transport substrate-binding protein
MLASILLLAVTAAGASAGTLDRIKTNGTLRLGYVDGVRPFSYRDASGNAEGYAVALCRKVADAVKAQLALPSLKTEFVQLGGEERFAAVSQGKVDLLCTGGPPTASLREQVSFSIPVFLGGIGGLMRKDAPANMREILEGRPEPYRPRWRASLGQVLRGRVFVVVRGTIAEPALAEKLGDLDVDAKIETVDSFASGVARVADRSADVLFADRAILLDAIKQSPEASNLVVLERHFSYNAPALALERGDEDFRLLVDKALSALYRSNEFPTLYADHFGRADDLALRFFRMSALQD